MNNFFYNDDIELIELEAGKNYRKVLAHGGSLMIVEVYFENGGIGAEHTHPHEQATYCVEGEFEFTVEGEKKVIKAGDTIYFQPDVRHGCRVLTPKGKLLDIFTPQREDFIKQ